MTRREVLKKGLFLPAIGALSFIDKKYLNNEWYTLEECYMGAGEKFPFKVKNKYMKRQPTIVKKDITRIFGNYTVDGDGSETLVRKFYTDERNQRWTSNRLHKWKLVG